MHPALSVIVFTTASGAGYGLLALLGIFAGLGALPANRWVGLASMTIALGLITAGLMSSTLHLGRPERAWRAFSQWRSSWLSREGVASLVTYVPACVFGLGWIVSAQTVGFVAFAGIASAVCAFLTIVATGMIYASLKPVAQWNSPYTVLGYLIYATMSGAVLLNAILQASEAAGRPILGMTLALILLGWVWKTLTWRHNNALKAKATANSATGLAGGTVRSIEWPHTEENYLLKEMSYRVARKHAARLRLFVHVFAFALPLATGVIASFAGRPIAIAASCIAVIAQGAGLLVERWLFFAEAKHTVSLYYGR